MTNNKLTQSWLKIKKYLQTKSLLKKMACLSLFWIVATIVFGAMTGLAISNRNLNLARHSAQITQLLMTPAHVLTFKQLPTLQMTMAGLDLVKLAPDCQQQFQDKQKLVNQTQQTAITQGDLQLLANVSQQLKQLSSASNHSLLCKLFLNEQQQNKLRRLAITTQNIQQLTTILTDNDFRITLLLQNNDEIRATGGFMGSVASTEIKQGQLDPIVFYDIYDLSGQLQPASNLRTTLPPQPGASQYLSSGGRLAITDANWHPDFSHSGPDILSLLNQTNLEQTDILMAVNLSLIKDLLKITGPINIPDFKQAVTANNISAIARQNRLSFFAGDRQKKNFLSQLYVHLKQQIPTLDYQQQQQLAKLAIKAAKQKQLLAFSPHPELQHIFEKLGITGAIKPDTDHFLYLVESNVGINKANQQIERRTAVGIQANSVNIDLNFINHNQPLEPETIEIIEQNPDLLQATHMGYVNYQRILTDIEPTNINIDCSWQTDPLDIIEQRQIAIRQGQAYQIGFVVKVPEQTSRICHIAIDANQQLLPNQSWTLFRQPGLPASNYRIKFFNQPWQELVLSQDTTLP